MKLIFRSIFLLILLSIASISIAQPNAPSEINSAIDDLSTRVGVALSVEDLESFRWEERRYDDTSLGCPQAGQAYNQVVTNTYRFLLEYNNQTYDYRVSIGGGIVVLCDQETSNGGQGSPCGDAVTVVEGDTLFNIAQRCETTIDILVEANESIESASSTLFVGTVLRIPNPSAISIQGAIMTIYPLAGSAGTEITVIINGLPVNTSIQLGLGIVGSEYTLTQSEQSDAFGALLAQIRIPDDAADNQQWVVVATSTNTSDELFSVPFLVNSEARATFDSVDIFLIQTGSGGDVGCGDSLVPVTMNIAPTVAPMTAAYEQLLMVGNQSIQGLYNALSQSNLSLQTATISNGEAIIFLTGNLIIGGVCDVPRVQAQLEQVALQYVTVDSVSIFINGIPLDEVLSSQ